MHLNRNEAEGVEEDYYCFRPVFLKKICKRILGPTITKNKRILDLTITKKWTETIAMMQNTSRLGKGINVEDSQSHRNH